MRVKKFTLDLDTVQILDRTQFGNEFFAANATLFYSLKYDNFYDGLGNMRNSDEVRESTGLDFTELQLFCIRGVCTTAKTKFKKRDLEMQKTTEITTFINRRKRGSNHIRKILMGWKHAGVTKNISKFANNMDIVITGEQSQILNNLWTKNYFSNQDRTFFFKFYNNILGYNNAVAHFVQGHNPYCTFCEITRFPDAIFETPAHLFYECRSVCNVIDNVYSSITGQMDFQYSRREHFTTFDRRDSSWSVNCTLTVVSKLIIKYIWDCKTHQCLPNVESCLESIKDKLTLQMQISPSIRNLVAGSRLVSLTNIINDDNVGF